MEILWRGKQQCGLVAQTPCHFTLPPPKKKRAAHTTALLNSNFLTRCCNFEAEHDRSDSGSPTYQKSTRHVDFWRQQDLFFRRTYRTVRITAPFGPAADINPHGIKTGDLHGEVIATGGHTRTARIHDGLPIATR